ncbi:phosphohistidine phosphatase SixA [Celerinatantimonas yamalensis]|uniref:Phosphohistidine phosphatase SixA n=1 Tax=Celerinatantimonas yamalensis TaxID=559956 RepID=A0ABW9G1X4_9GAMM
MDIYVMRHGQAGMVAKRDSERELTADGRAQVKMMATQLATKTAQFDYVLVSPFVRAQQTWEEASSAFSEPSRVITLNELTPDGDAKAVSALVDEFAADSQILVISHLPLVGYLVQEFVPSAGAPLFATAAIAHIHLTTSQSKLVALEHPA